MKSARLAMRLGVAGAVVATSVFLVAGGASARPNMPHIISVTFSGSSGNYTVTVRGHHFGSPVSPVPFTGDVTNFRIQDNDQLGLPGAGEWGYGSDTNKLTYSVWTANEIQVTGAGLASGDAVFLALQNGVTGLGASWGGNVPVAPVGTPVITVVGASSLGHLPSLRLSISGHGFGSSPKPLPFVGDIDQFSMSDPEVHCGGASALTAGGSYFGTRAPDAITMRFTQWTDTRIIVSGFAGAYGSGCNVVQEGDAFTVSVWNSGAVSPTGLASAHRGTLLYPGIAH